MFLDRLLGAFPGGNMASRSFRFSWIRWTGSVLPRVWMTVIFWTLYTTLFVLIAELGGYRQNLSAPNTAPITLIGGCPQTLAGHGQMSRPCWKTFAEPRADFKSISSILFRRLSAQTWPGHPRVTSDSTRIIINHHYHQFTMSRSLWGVNRRIRCFPASRFPH